MARIFKDGGIPFCWQCGRQLVRIKGGFIYANVIDQDGVIHRVHKDCVQFVIGDGIKELPNSYKEKTI
jgi:hypothetical protein